MCKLCPTGDILEVKSYHYTPNEEGDESWFYDNLVNRLNKKGKKIKEIIDKEINELTEEDKEVKQSLEELKLLIDDWSHNFKILPYGAFKEFKSHVYTLNTYERDSKENTITAFALVSTNAFENSENKYKESPTKLYALYVHPKYRGKEHEKMLLELIGDHKKVDVSEITDKHTIIRMEYEQIIKNFNLNL